MFKSFFIHERNEHNKRGPKAITFYISPDVSSDSVLVSYTCCNPKDQFVKALGRKNAMAAQNVVSIYKRKLPYYLSQVIVQESLYSSWHKTEEEYHYVLKYVV